MILSDVFERFSQDSPLSVMAQGVMENALNPQILDQLFEDVAQRQFTNKLLFSTIVDLMSVVVCRIRPSIHAAFQARAETVGATIDAVYDKLDGTETAVSAALVHSVADRLGAGHRRDERRPGGLAARLSRPDPRRQPSPRLRAPDQGVADHPRRGLARSCAGRARPPADVGHRRGPVRRRSCAGAVAAGSDPGDRRGQGPLDRRPQLLHDRLPLRDRRAGRFLRDPTTRLDAPLGVRRQAAGLRPDRHGQGLRADDPGHQRRGRDPHPAADHRAPGPADAGRGDRTPHPDERAGQGRQGENRLPICTDAAGRSRPRSKSWRRRSTARSTPWDIPRRRCSPSAWRWCRTTC